MSNPPKKVPRHFRISSDLDAELKRRSELTGITETRIVEDALRAHFSQSMRQKIAKTLDQLKGFPVNPNWSLTPYMSNALTVPV